MTRILYVILVFVLANIAMGEVALEDDFVTGILQRADILYTDSVTRYFYYVLPESYDPEIENPLYIWLHGGVSREELPEINNDVLESWQLIPRLLEEGYVIAFPCGQQGAVWWDRVGEQGILDIVKRMKFNFNISDSKVFVGGFSDGASGTMSLMMLHPDYFAGYLAFSGHIGVAALDGGRGTYLPNLANRPGIMTHSDEDGLYPTEGMASSIQIAEDAGAEFDYYTFPFFDHDPGYLPQIEDEIISFLSHTERARFPSEIIWETSEPTGCDWLRIDSVIPWPLIGEDFDFNTLMVSDRIRFGFYPDRDYEGSGVRIAVTLEDDCPALRLGLLEGDVITGFMGSEVLSMHDLSEITGEMQAGDTFDISILRDGNIIEMSDSFNPPAYYWLLPRENPSVRIDASYSDNKFELEVNRMCNIRLLLHPEMVDFSEEIIVVCNGYEVFRDVVQEDESFAELNFVENYDSERMSMAIKT